MTYAGAWEHVKRTLGHRALIAGLAVELAWCLFAAASRLRAIADEGLVYSLTYLLAAALSVAVLVWAGLYIGLLRRTAPERGRPYLLVLLAFAAVAQIVILVLLKPLAAEGAEVRTAAHEVESAAGALRDAPDTAIIDVRPKANGDAGELERLIKTYLVVLQSDRRAYRGERQAAGVPDHLGPDLIARDGTLGAARAGLAKGRAIVAKYRARYHARKAQVRKAIAFSRLSFPAKRVILAVFDRVVAGADRGDAVWNAEDARLAEMDAAAVDLQRARGRWKVRGGELVFSDPAALQIYDRHLVELQVLAARKASLRDQSFRQARAVVARVRALVG